MNSPETCQELNLFESKEHLGQAVQWYHHELWKLKIKKKDNKVKATDCRKGRFIPGTWGVRPDWWEQTKHRWDENQRRRDRRRVQRARGPVSLPRMRMKNSLKLEMQVVGFFPLLLVIYGNICNAEEINALGWHQQNMWLIWANATAVDSFCLPSAMPGDPFHTCLSGIPISNFTCFTRWLGVGGRPCVGANRSSAENHWFNKTKGKTKLDMCKRLGIRPNG